MQSVAEDPELEATPFVSQFEADHGSFESLGDALRRIGLDEREHKLESEVHLGRPRFGLEARANR